MELRLKMRLVLLIAVLVCGCAQTPEPPDAEAARAHAKAVAEAEARAAVAVVGTRVCRRLAVGIADSEWISGVVTETRPETVTVQIDNPGRMSHMVDGVLVTRGASLRGRAERWTPCR